MGFHTRAWQNSTFRTLPFLSLCCRNTSIFWGSGWVHFLCLKFSAHKNTEQKPLCPLQLVTSTEYLQTVSQERLGTFGKVSDIYLLTSSPRHGSLRGIFMSHVLLKWYWRVCTQLKEDVYEGDGGNIKKNQKCAIHSGKQLAGRTCSHGSPHHKPCWSSHTSFLL